MRTDGYRLKYLAVGCVNRSQDVPPVDVADLNAAWNVFKEAKADQGNIGIGIGLLERVCPPGADMRAVSYRSMQLGLLTTVPLDVAPGLAPLLQDGELTQVALKVGARFPMTWVAVGAQGEMPFDLEAFVAEVQKESERGEP